MNNFQKRFHNYKTPQGLTLDLEENEFIVVDGFDFRPDNFVSLIVFITDRRFIFKETKLGLAPGGLTYEVLEKADVTFMWFKDIEYFVFKPSTPGLFGIRLKGITTDLSKKQKRRECLMVGQVSPAGGYGHTSASLHERISTQLAISAEENSFQAMFGGKYAHLSNMTDPKILSTVKSGETRRAIFNVFGAILLLGGGIIMISYWNYENEQLQPQSQAGQFYSKVTDERAPQLDASTIVTPTRDTTGQYDYVVKKSRSHDTTCFTTAYPGSNGEDGKTFGCSINSAWASDRSTKVFNVLWDDGIRTTIHILDNGAVSIGSGSSWESGQWSFFDHEGEQYYYIKANKGAGTWIPVNAFEEGLKS